jgi:uncharacterized membrane protein HdeD (DUF308 family)
MDIVKQEPWWSLLLRGIFIIILGVVAFVWPAITVLVLVFLFGAFALVDGIFAVVVSLSQRRTVPMWGLVLAGGIAGIVVGILIFAWPLISTLVILYLFAAWLVVTGIIRIVTAIGARRETAMGLPLTLGIVSVCFGAAIFVIPLFMLVTVLWIAAAFAIIVGIFLLADSIRVHKLTKATS